MRNGTGWRVCLPGSAAVGPALDLIRGAAGSVESLVPVHPSLEERFLAHVGHAALGLTLELRWRHRFAVRELLPQSGWRGGGASRSAVIAVAAIVPYLNALPADFTFDDVGVISENVAVQIHPAADLLTYVYYPGGLYRPLTMLTYAANASIDARPWGYHLVNVVLHALVSIAVFFLARRLLDSAVAATVAALLFAVHPIHTEAVTGIVGRAELLAALGVLVSLLAVARALNSTAEPPPPVDGARRWPPSPPPCSPRRAPSRRSA